MRGVNVKLLLASILISVITIGCAEPMNLNDEAPPKTQLGQEVNDASEVQLQKAIKVAGDVQQKVDAGDFNFQGLIDTDKLDDLKDQILEKLDPVLGKFTVVKEKINELKAQLRSEIDLLDPTNPKEAEMIADIEKAIAKLDKANAKIDKVINKVLDKLDELSAKLDKLIDKIDTGNVLAIILKMKIREIKNDEVGSIRDLLWALLMLS